ncbi:pilus assembly protein PilM [Patescibacteria group bacterium]|nr:pilus assembly protein PilM [Patescibacteria group bacterium]
MFNFFKSKASSYLGIDIGTKSIKLVELENVSGRPRLVTYGAVEVDSSVARSDESQTSRQDQEKIAQAIKMLLQKTGAISRNAVAALPNFSVFSSLISLPKLGEKQIAEAVQWEAKKFVPMPIENVVLDWKILNKNNSNQQAGDSDKEKAPVSNAGGPEKPEQENAPDNSMDKNLAKCDTVLNILLTAAPRHLVERYVSIFKLAGLNLLSLETESFALSRSLIGNEEGTILIADVGSLTTDLTVVRFSVPVFSRSVNVGGKTITKAISDSMGIDIERAEQFKRDAGMGSSQAGQTGQAETGGVSKIIEQSFSSVINEMKYTLETQAAQGRPVEKILLTGGSSSLPSLDSYISKSLNIKVFIANPWARVSYPRDLEEVLNQIAQRIGVSVGLAMREIE